MERNMAKRVGFLRIKDGISAAQFFSHWENVHAQLAKDLPGLRRYAVNFIDRNAYPDSAYDGFSELWFDSKEEHDAAFSSPQGQKVLADVANFAVLYGVVVTEKVFVA